MAYKVMYRLSSLRNRDKAGSEQNPETRLFLGEAQPTIARLSGSINKSEIRKVNVQNR